MPKVEAAQCASREERLGIAAVQERVAAAQSNPAGSSGQKVEATPSS
jgi:hypothetical protein